MRLRWGSRKATAFWCLAAVGVLGNGLRLRKRALSLPVVGAARPAEGPAPEWEWARAPDVSLPDAAREAVERWAEAEGLDVVDVVPRDLRTEDALELVRSVDPASYARDPLAAGVSALQALGARSEVWRKARLAPSPGSDPLQMRQLAVSAKRYRPARSGIAVAPGASAAVRDLDRRLAYERYVLGPFAGIGTLASVAGYASLAAGLVVAPLPAAVALAAWCAQPLVVFLGTPLRPADMWWRVPLRWACGPIDLVRVLLGKWRPDPATGPAPDIDALRASYSEALADGLAGFFEGRRPDCPACASTGLRMRLRGIPDMLQGKPGRFDLDECGACGHVFQNPALSDSGLSFYYRDFYDGIGAEQMQVLGGTTPELYRDRVEVVGKETRPRRWLDVGTGYGQFCLVAKQMLPETTFDGLDLADSIDEAERRGWVQTGHRGQLVDLAPALAGSYDVVSMHHYLEHTRSPWTDLEAAMGVLAPGGLLSIEQPDPDCRYARILGRYWLPWFQPQHLNMVRAANLSAGLTERGMEILGIDRGPLHPPADFLGATFFLFNRLAPDWCDRPWRPDAGVWGRLRALAVAVALLPLAVLAAIADRTLNLLPLENRGDSYRLVARMPVADGDSLPEVRGTRVSECPA